MLEMIGGPDDGKKVQVAIERGEDGEPEWKNLPVEFNAFMSQYSHNEQLNDPLGLL